MTRSKNQNVLCFIAICILVLTVHAILLVPTLLQRQQTKSQKSEDAGTWVSRAEQDIELGNYGRAERGMGNVKRGDMQLAHYVQLARAYETKQQWGPADEWWRLAVEAYPKDTFPIHQRALNMRNIHNGWVHKEAVRLLEATIVLHEELARFQEEFKPRADWVVYRDLALAKLKVEDKAGALAAATKAIERADLQILTITEPHKESKAKAMEELRKIKEDCKS